MKAVMLILGLLSQQPTTPSQEQLKVLIEQLESADISTRESSERELKKLSEADLGALRAHLKSARDEEVSLRLKRVISHILEQKANRLLNDAKLDEALDALAEASHKDDPGEFRKTRLLEVRATLYSWLPSDRISDPDIPYEDLAKRVKLHGIWGLAVLVDMFRNTDNLFWYHIQSRRILRQMGKQAAPALVVALQDKTPRIRAAACSELENLGDRSDLVINALRKVFSNPNGTSVVREYASDALFELTDKRP